MTRRILLRAVILVPLAGALSVASLGPAQGLPARPTPAQSRPANSTLSAANAKVAVLQAQVAAEQAQIAKSQQLAERAQQDYNDQQDLLVAAQTALATAQAELLYAQDQYKGAHTAFVTIAVQSYIGGEPSNLASVFASTSVADLLTRVNDQDVIAAARARIQHEMDVARTAQRAAETSMANAANAQQSATSKADNDLVTANSNLVSARQLQDALTAQLLEARQDAATAVAALAALSSIEDGLSLAQERVLDAKFEAEAITLEKIPISAKSAHWTAAMGQSAVDRALAWLGLPYAFAGGSISGPTNGVCSGADGGGGENDCQVWGFDCSGLSLYSWGPYLNLAHDAAIQYNQAGRVHPAVSSLAPGDLVFWSADGTASGISHVAIYVGGGSVVQAPQSGDVVRLTPLASVEPGYFGATRPLS